jgi:hypothetical protein
MTFNDVLEKYELKGASDKEIVRFMKHQFGMVVSYINEGHPIDTRDNLDNIGVALSQGLRWQGDNVLKVAVAALTDCNYHKEAAMIEEMSERCKWCGERMHTVIRAHHHTENGVDVTK